MQKQCRKEKVERRREKHLQSSHEAGATLKSKYSRSLPCKVGIWSCLAISVQYEGSLGFYIRKRYIPIKLGRMGFMKYQQNFNYSTNSRLKAVENWHSVKFNKICMFFSRFLSCSSPISTCSLAFEKLTSYETNMTKVSNH